MSVSEYRNSVQWGKQYNVFQSPQKRYLVRIAYFSIFIFLQRLKSCSQALSNTGGEGADARQQCRRGIMQQYKLPNKQQGGICLSFPLGVVVEDAHPQSSHNHSLVVCRKMSICIQIFLMRLFSLCSLYMIYTYMHLYVFVLQSKCILLWKTNLSHLLLDFMSLYFAINFFLYF